VTEKNPFADLSSLRQAAAAVDPPPPKKPRKRPFQQPHRFALVPLDDDRWLRAMAVAGSGAAIVVWWLHMYRTKGKREVDITAAFMRRCGLSRKVRHTAISKLVKAGYGTVKYNGPHSGCPKLTLHPPHKAKK
jgi:hypothetical protein